MKQLLKHKKIIFLSIIVIVLLIIFGIKVINKYYDMKDRLDNSKTDKINSLNKYIDYKKSDKAIKIPIITFHRVVDHETKVKYFKNNEWINDLDITNEELKWLYDNGWKTINLDEFYCWYMNECEFDKKTFVITIDDGDAEAYYNVLPLLDKYNFDATLFVIGSTVPDVTPELKEPDYSRVGLDLIEKLRKEKSRLHFESHSYDLHNQTSDGSPIASTYSIEDIEKDFDLNSKYNFKYYAYPYGYYNSDILSVISNRKDIKLAFSFGNFNYATRLNNRYEIDRIKISANTTIDEFKKWFEY